MNYLKLTIVLLFLQGAFASEVETWTSANGHSFQGTFISMNANSVALKGSDGKVITVPFTALDAKSQAMAQQHGQGATENTRSFYQHKSPHLRFSLSPTKNWIEFEFLDAQNVLNNTKYVLSLRLSETKGGVSKAVNIKKAMGAPKVTRDEVQMHLLMANGVEIVLSVDLNDKKTLRYRFEAVEIPEGLPQMRLQSTMAFPALLVYEMETETYVGPLAKSGVHFDDLPDLLQEHSISFTSIKGKEQKLAYHQKQKGSYTATEAVIHLPGKKDLLFESPKDPEDGNIFLRSYNGKPAFQGYGMRAMSGEKNYLCGGPFTIGLQ